MNSGAPANDPVVDYYDSDYPAQEFNPYPENFDAVTSFQGIRHDVARYAEIAAEVDGRILELCCGTGRIALPLAARGHRVTAVDVSQGMIERFRTNLARYSTEVRGRLELVRQDATELNLPQRDFDVCIIGFNSLLCITEFEAQRTLLRRAAEHLRLGGHLVLDVVNPLQLPPKGSSVPQPFFTRRSMVTGRRYTRFAMRGPVDADQRQELHGWYDELAEDGSVRRIPYSMHWRPIFRFELELMLETAGFDLISVEGGHSREPFVADSPHIFMRAVKRPGRAPPA